MVRIVELVSPAGDFAALNAAISNGADGVYVGLKECNMRANAANFSLEDLKKAVEISHEQGKKIFVCTNTLMKDEQIRKLKEVVPNLYSTQVDALVVSDLGALKIARENDMDVHMSVQVNLSNFEALKLLETLGVKRVILSRELSLVEIEKIEQNTNLEVEVFVHGAMCLAISGRCFLSSYLYRKSANCGECLQPCRKEWKLVSEDSEEFRLDQIRNQNHILSPKDLCMVEHVPRLIEAGVDALKIEGRGRPADYVATVTRVYREAVDRCRDGCWKFDQRWIHELKKVYNRGFDTGFYFQPPYKTSEYNQSTHIKRDVGSVSNYYPQVSAAEIRLWDDLEVGDEILIQGHTTGSLIQLVDSIQIQGINIQKASRGQSVGISVNGKVRPNDLVYKRLPRKKEGPAYNLDEIG